MLLILTTSCDENKTIYVASNMVDCDEIPGKKCLQIKENKEDEWTLFHETIDGFNYKEGYLHKIDVNISKAKKSSADSNKLKYKLNSIIYQEPILTKSSQSLLSAKKWKVKLIVGIDSLAVSPTIDFDETTNTISGNAGCNNYNTSYTKKDDILSFGLVASTKMMCSNMSVEKAFIECLKDSHHFKTENDTLLFYSANDSLLMSCIIAE